MRTNDPDTCSQWQSWTPELARERVPERSSQSTIYEFRPTAVTQRVKALVCLVFMGVATVTMFRCGSSIAHGRISQGLQQACTNITTIFRTGGEGSLCEVLPQLRANATYKKMVIDNFDINKTKFTEILTRTNSSLLILLSGILRWVD